ncbi:MAG: response regulator [Acidobacteria bacterium]|nr:response regulator [Acidobacteriota bacterium]MCL5289312.1 response regulator [Acidobacteriota bacterium]
MKILVADDNRSIPKKVTEALKDLGYEVLGVGHGEAAVKKMPEFMPDLVLADVFMPVRNGYEVCEFVKNDQRFAHIPVVLLVGAFDPIDQHEVKRVRADGLLKKPFDPPSDLLEMVKTMLEKSAQARPAAETKAGGPRVGDTVELSATEMKGLTPETKPPEPEPEIEEFATRPARVEFGESSEGMSFGELLEAPAETEAPKVIEKGPKPEAEGFRASSVPDIEFAGEKEEEEEEASQPSGPPAAAEAPPWGAAMHAETEAAATEAAAPPETPQWGGIEVPAKEPSPEEPPIKVEFEPSEPMELVLDEAEAPAESHVEAGPLPELASTPDEFMSAAASSAAPPATAPKPEAPAATAKAPEFAAEPFSIPSMEEVAAPPAAVEPAPPPEPPPVAAVEPPRAPAPMIPPPMEIPRIMRPPEPEPPAPAQPAPFTGNTDAFARPHVNPADVDAIVEKVIARLQKGVLDQITRDILRPIIEALVAREIQNKQ